MNWTDTIAATDLSEPADLALREAHDRAGSAGRLTVIHVPPSLQRSNPLFPQFNQPQAEAVASREERLVGTVTARVVRVTGRRPSEFTVVIGDGDEAAAITQLARSSTAGLVILGSCGAGLSRLLLGGVAEKVTRLAPCPVLVVRPRTGSGCIVAGTDFSDPSLPALETACREAARVGGSVTFVHSIELPVSPTDFLVAGASLPPATDVSGLEADALGRLREILAAHGTAGQCRVVFEPAASALVREAGSVRADLVVVGTHGRTGIGHALLGSVAEAVVRTAPCSVMVVRLA
jgi:nucleotide-binding universal stress UspA family protein